ncbi:uncharacterized protein CTRU02_210101 [Colletotrichum truncatum]|uniref:Integral membrane protein n=1 Tax=Colletotrichum truncatum TaxID=5467 RepID=A0ACC3YUA3_COLTU|nr:uncharacterized protein CTRU02_02677 [Colletotrichum truncatum]KAF6798703.1 integral membrane protein [Colletotrichum truncatum]
MSTNEHLDPAWVADNRGPWALGVVICVSVISTIFVAARLFTRAKIMGRVCLDDYLIIVSAICGWINVATAAVAVSYGYGRHVDTLSPEQRSGAKLWSIAGYPPGLLSFGIPKLAVVALLTRIMNPSRGQKIFLWGMASLCVANLVGFIAIIFGQCYPARSQWDPSVPGTCWDKSVLVSFATYSGAFCAFADIYLSVYPAVVLSKLQMNIRKKVALSIALGLGSLSSIVVIYKCTKLGNLASSDYTYDTVELVIYTVVEGSMIIIAACIPVLQPLCELLFGKRIFSGGRNTYANYRSRVSSRWRSTMDLSRSFGRKSAQPKSDTDTLNSIVQATGTRGSQESILEKHAPGGNIVRTDVFTVTVESKQT